MKKNNDVYEMIKKMFEEKKKNTADEEKIRTIENLLKNDMCFFNIPLETALRILKFIGVTDEELIPIYKELMSPENYLSHRKKIRMLFPNNEIKPKSKYRC